MTPPAGGRRRIVADSAPWPAQGAPYSQAMCFADLVWAAAQLPIDPATGSLAEPGVRAEAKQCLTNLQAVLETARSGLDCLLKVTVFLADRDDWAAVNEVYAAVLPTPYPARSIHVGPLPRGASVALDAVAHVRPG